MNRGGEEEEEERAEEEEGAKSDRCDLLGSSRLCNGISHLLDFRNHCGSAD